MSKGGGIGGAIFGALAAVAVEAVVDGTSHAVRTSNNPKPIEIKNLKCPKCKSSTTLRRAKHIYPNSSRCRCDICRKSIGSYGWAYHCDDHRNKFHSQGYDLCQKCASATYQRQKKVEKKVEKIENDKYIESELIAMGFDKNDVQKILPNLDKSDKRQAVHQGVKLLCNKPKDACIDPKYSDMKASAPVMEEEGATGNEIISYEQEGVPDTENNISTDSEKMNVHMETSAVYSNDLQTDEKLNDFVQPSAPVLDEKENELIETGDVKVAEKMVNNEVVSGGKDKKKVNDVAIVSGWYNDKIYKKGWMMKSGEINPFFKARFFELCRDKRLKYYRAEPIYDEYGFHEFNIPQSYFCGQANFGSHKIKKMHKLKNNGFHVVTEARTWKFNCNTEIERDEWYDAIKSICTVSK